MRECMEAGQRGNPPGWVRQLIGSNLTYCFSFPGALLIDHLLLFVLICLISLLISQLILRQLDLA